MFEGNRIRCRICNERFVEAYYNQKCCSEACQTKLDMKECCGIPGPPQKLRDIILATTPEQWNKKAVYAGGCNGRGYAFPLVPEKKIWIEFDIGASMDYAGFYVKQYTSQYGGPNFGIHFATDGIAYDPNEVRHNPSVTYGKTTDVNDKFKEIDAHYENIKKHKIQGIEDDFKNMLEERFGT